MEVTELIALASRLFELAGVGVMVAGAFVALGLVVAQFHRRSGESSFRHFRQKLGRAILLGLELLVAADIIRTVSETPTLEGVLVLGLIVLIRTFLSFTLAVELEGYWPWQRARFKGKEESGRSPPPSRPPEGKARASEEQPLEH